MTMKNEFYHKKAGAYIAETLSLDPSHYLTPFTDMLKSNDLVVDIGCGSGRDLLWLKKKGFDPIGIERSPAMATFARGYSGCPVIEADFQSFDFSKLPSNGILFSASLVHTPHNQIESIIKNAMTSVSGPGFMYISLKEGDGIKISHDGRRFYLWKTEALQKLFKRLGLTTITIEKSRSEKAPGDIWLSCTLCFEQTRKNPLP